MHKKTVLDWWDIDMHRRVFASYKGISGVRRFLSMLLPATLKCEESLLFVYACDQIYHIDSHVGRIIG